MKEVKLIVPKKHEPVLLDLVEKTKLKGQRFETEEDVMFIFFITSEYVNSLVNEAKKRGIGSAFGSIVISDAVIVGDFSDENIDLLPHIGVNVEELISTLKPTATVSITYVLLTTIAAVLAALGLFYDSVVTIIASMIVAPLMGPIALTAVGLIYPEGKILKQGIIAEIIGLLLSILIGIISGFILPHSEPSREMLIRAVLSPDVFWFAVFSGAAAGVIISKGMDLSIVGVAIAASLAPPAVNSGLLLAQGYPALALNASIIVLLNVLAIDFSCSLMFHFYGITETASVSERQTKKSKKLNALVIMVVGGLIIVIGLFILLRGNLVNMLFH